MRSCSLQNIEERDGVLNEEGYLMFLSQSTSTKLRHVSMKISDPDLCVR